MKVKPKLSSDSSKKSVLNLHLRQWTGCRKRNATGAVATVTENGMSKWKRQPKACLKSKACVTDTMMNASLLENENVTVEQLTDVSSITMPVKGNHAYSGNTDAVCSASKSCFLRSTVCDESEPSIETEIAVKTGGPICEMCERANGDVIQCTGPCLGMFHARCTGHTAFDGSFMCEECYTGVHTCFECKQASESTVQCSVPSCGRYYHIECLSRWGVGVRRKDSARLVCPQHSCATCAAVAKLSMKTLPKTSKELVLKCLRCPVAYHADRCITAGSTVMDYQYIICSKHQAKRQNHVNIAWCSTCLQDDGSLLQCNDCSASYHVECSSTVQMKGSTVRWACPNCAVGRKPVYGEVVWAKFGNYRWWPAEVLPLSALAEYGVASTWSSNEAEFCVKLFGNHLVYGSHHGRVFLFQVADRLCRESAVPTYTRYRNYKNYKDLYTKAVREATEAWQQWTAKQVRCLDEPRSDKKPPPYKHVKGYVPLGKVEIKRAAVEDIPKCRCLSTDVAPCGPESNCINRAMLYECHPLVCSAGEKCCNQAFQQRQLPTMRPFNTGSRGWGLKTMVDIEEGQFVSEYVGDLIDKPEALRRLVEAYRNNVSNFYMMSLDDNRIIDAGPKGNYSRFMNNSCEPNCETQKWTVNGDVRIGLFAMQNIPAGSELTFNYHMNCFAGQKVRCRCGSHICSGYLGVRPKTAAAMHAERKTHEAQVRRQQKRLKCKKSALELDVKTNVHSACSADMEQRVTIDSYNQVQIALATAVAPRDIPSTAIFNGISTAVHSVESKHVDMQNSHSRLNVKKPRGRPRLHTQGRPLIINGFKFRPKHAKLTNGFRSSCLDLDTSHRSLSVKVMLTDISASALSNGETAKSSSAPVNRVDNVSVAAAAVCDKMSAKPQCLGPENNNGTVDTSNSGGCVALLKKRGRPPKMSCSTTSLHRNSAAVGVKRKPGRPRKLLPHSSSHATTAALQKRGRGRPPRKLLHNEPLTVPGGAVVLQEFEQPRKTPDVCPSNGVDFPSASPGGANPVLSDTDGRFLKRLRDSASPEHEQGQRKKRRVDSVDDDVIIPSPGSDCSTRAAGKLGRPLKRSPNPISPDAAADSSTVMSNAVDIVKTCMRRGRPPKADHSGTVFDNRSTDMNYEQVGTTSREVISVSPDPANNMPVLKTRGRPPKADHSGTLLDNRSTNINCEEVVTTSHEVLSVSRDPANHTLVLKRRGRLPKADHTGGHSTGINTVANCEQVCTTALEVMSFSPASASSTPLLKRCGRLPPSVCKSDPAALRKRGRPLDGMLDTNTNSSPESQKCDRSSEIEPVALLQWHKKLSDSHIFGYSSDSTVSYDSIRKSSRGQLEKKLQDTVSVAVLPADEQALSPTRKQTLSRNRKQASSPDRRQALSPDRKQALSPSRKQASSPDRRQALSPNCKQALSLNRKQVLSPDCKQASSPTRKKALSANRKQASSPTRKQALSPDCKKACHQTVNRQ